MFASDGLESTTSLEIERTDHYEVDSPHEVRVGAVSIIIYAMVDWAYVRNDSSPLTKYSVRVFLGLTINYLYVNVQHIKRAPPEIAMTIHHKHSGHRRNGELSVRCTRIQRSCSFELSKIVRRRSSNFTFTR